MHFYKLPNKAFNHVCIKCGWNLSLRTFISQNGLCYKCIEELRQLDIDSRTDYVYSEFLA